MIKGSCGDPGAEGASCWARTPIPPHQMSRALGQFGLVCRFIPPQALPPLCSCNRLERQPGKPIEVSLDAAARAQGHVLFVSMPRVCLSTVLRRIDRSCRKAE